MDATSDVTRIDEARRFLATNHRAVLITRRASDRLQSSPVAAVAVPDGRLLISTRKGSAKERNVERNPDVSLCAVSDAWFGPWVHIDGTAEIVRLPQAMELLVEYYERISGPHPDPDAYRQAMVAEERVILRVTLDHATKVVAS